MNYKTIKCDGITETIIKKSRFICQLKRIDNEEDGKQFLNQIKKEHYKANHSCSALIIGDTGQIKRSSDDGEPSGTAGIPMLTVLEKQELTNVIAVVTRYFSGIKLGTGGLIRAYSNAVSSGISTIGLVQVKEQIEIKVTLSYHQYQLFENFLKSQQLQEHETIFLEKIQTSIFIDEADYKKTCEALLAFYQGKIVFEKAPSRLIEVPL